MKSLDVYFLPQLCNPDTLRGTSAVVIDVLRATTTITHACAAGAKYIIPCLEIDRARKLAKSIGEQAVLAGERGGLPIDGFDLGNGPGEFTEATVAGKTVLFTTTNGTKALDHCRSAAEILVGSFVNLNAIVRHLGHQEHVSLLCAGTNGQITQEDTLFAGCVALALSTATWSNASHQDEMEPAKETLLSAKPVDQPKLNDQALIAMAAASGLAEFGPNRSLQWNSARIIKALRKSSGGQNLIGVGLEADIELAGQIDRFNLVPQLQITTGRISIR